MFEYFPNNYVWNLALNIALNSGARMGEVDEVSRPLLDIASKGADAGTEAFLTAWSGLAGRLIGLAREDEARGRLLSAGEKYGRASTYLTTAERLQRQGASGREAAYRTMLDCFASYMRLGGEPSERVEVPYEGKPLACYFYPGQATVHAPAPCMIFVNGLDSTKEMIYRSGFAQALARRGASTLMVDQPGVGEALRLHGLAAVPQAERWASVLVDYLQGRPDVRPDRIGIMGWSLGGYYAPRAAAFEPRLQCCVAWGANYNWGELQKRRLAREGSNPVPHYWEHVQWVWGAKSMEEFMALTPSISLEGVLHQIRMPALVTHGSNDRQIPIEYAHRTFDELVNSPKRELKIYTAQEGGIEHVSIDAQDNARDYIADWVSETLAGNAATM